jgi:hypothetical protein
MTTRMIPPTLLVLLTLACGSNPPGVPGNGMQSAAPAGNPVAALSDGQRKAVFIRAIRDAGLPCQHVDSSAPGGAYRGMPVWTAVCQGGGRWTIVIGSDGGAQILNAEEARIVTDAQSNTVRR